MSAARTAKTGRRKPTTVSRQKKATKRKTGTGATRTRKKKVSVKKITARKAAVRRAAAKKTVKKAARKTAGGKTAKKKTTARAAMTARTTNGIPPSVLRYKEAKDAYSRGITLLQEKDWAGASRALADFLADYSRERELAERARMYLRVCGQHLDTGDAAPKTFDDRYYLAVVLSNRGELNRALEVVEDALAGRPDSRKAQYLKASILALKRSRRAALDALARAIELDDQNRIYAANDPDFSGLRDDEEFITLTTREDDEGA